MGSGVIILNLYHHKKLGHVAGSELKVNVGSLDVDELYQLNSHLKKLQCIHGLFLN